MKRGGLSFLFLFSYRSKHTAQHNASRMYKTTWTLFYLLYKMYAKEKKKKRFFYFYLTFSSYSSRSYCRERSSDSDGSDSSFFILFCLSEEEIRRIFDVVQEQKNMSAKVSSSFTLTIISQLLEISSHFVLFSMLTRKKRGGHLLRLSTPFRLSARGYIFNRLFSCTNNNGGRYPGVL